MMWDPEYIAERIEVVENESVIVSLGLPVLVECILVGKCAILCKYSMHAFT